jgi:hypothetical protein
VPDSYIVVSPELLILTACNAYLADTLQRRDELVGRNLFDALPDNPAAPEAHAVRNWAEDRWLGANKARGAMTGLAG